MNTQKYVARTGPLPLEKFNAQLNDNLTNLHKLKFKILNIIFIVISENFVHPEQSFMLAQITYRKRIFGIF